MSSGPRGIGPSGHEPHHIERFLFPPLRPLVAIVLAVLVVAGTGSPSTADTPTGVDAFDCVSMRFRLEPFMDSNGDLVPFKYRLELKQADDCRFTRVNLVPALAVPAHVKLDIHPSLRDNDPGSTCDPTDVDDCWPVLCQGPAVNNALFHFEVFQDSFPGQSQASYQVHGGQLRFEHLNPAGTSAPGVVALTVLNPGAGGVVVAGAGVFRDVAGGCGAGFLEFEGNLVASDPAVPDTSELPPEGLPAPPF